MNRPEMSMSWNYADWLSLLLILLSITVVFIVYIYQLTKEPKKANLVLGIMFLSTNFISLGFAY